MLEIQANWGIFDPQLRQNEPTHGRANTDAQNERHNDRGGDRQMA